MYECQCAIGGMCACTRDRGCHEDGNDDDNDKNSDGKRWLLTGTGSNLSLSGFHSFQKSLPVNPVKSAALDIYFAFTLLSVHCECTRMHDCLGIIPPRDKALQHLEAHISANHTRTQVPDTDLLPNTVARSPSYNILFMLAARLWIYGQMESF